MCHDRGSNPGIRNEPPAPQALDHCSTIPPARATDLLTCFTVLVTKRKREREREREKERKREREREGGIERMRWFVSDGA